MMLWWFSADYLWNVYDMCILVGGFKHVLFFHILGIIIIPTDFHIFQRGRYTTNQLYIAIDMTMRIGAIIIPTDFHIFQRGSNHQPVMIGWDDNLGLGMSDSTTEAKPWVLRRGSGVPLAIWPAWSCALAGVLVAKYGEMKRCMYIYIYIYMSQRYRYL